MNTRDKIKVLDVRQQCREKVSIWFGSRDNGIHPFKEIIANSSDEINNNFENGIIDVELFEDGTLSISDTGRGIPIEGKTNGVPNYELLFKTLFSGTNYDNAENGKITTGTNGCGTCVINHCSSLFKVISYRNHKKYSITFENGGYLSGKLETEDNKEGRTGTTTIFKLDDLVFENFKYDIEELKSIIKNSAGVNNKITYKFKYLNEAIEYHYNSIEDFFEDETGSNTCKPIIGKQKLFKNTIATSESTTVDEEDTIELILSTSPEVVQKSFLNITHLTEGGSIDKGVIKGVRKFVNQYATKNKLLDKKLGNVTDNDVKESISFLCNMLSTVVEYANQTKLSTNKRLYEKIASTYTGEVLEIELIENPKNIEKLVKHILEVQRFNNRAIAARNKMKKKLSEKVDSIANRIEKLTDCKIHGEDAELFIAEGDSAKGSIVLARNSEFQACLAIKGKIMNVLKKSYTEIFESKTIMDIIKTLGCGIETDKKNKDIGEFDEKALRYGKIILATDMDSDGYQIQCLLLSLFYKLTPTLIKNGRIYIAITPLYEVRLKNDENLYWFSESEKELYISKNGYKDIKYVARAKGLGELDPLVMSETGINPKTRNIVQVTVDDVEAMIKSFEIWMEDDSSERKEKLMNDLNQYSGLD